MRSRSILALLGLSLTLAACGRGVAPTAAHAVMAAGATAQEAPGRAIVHWVSKTARAAFASKLGLGAPDALDDDGDELVSLLAGQSVASLRAQVGTAASVEPDYVMHLPVARPDAQDDPPEMTVERARRGRSTSREQYALQLVNAQQAWQVTRGRPEVKIAVIDSGIDDTHPELADRIAASAMLIGMKGRLGVGSARDDNGHGTHCAGIAAANGKEGVSGIAPECSLLIAKVLDKDGAGDTSDIARGVNWAIAHGANVISMSMGGTEDSRPLHAAVAKALAEGIVVVAAMGNEGHEQRNFPAAYPGVIAVGATTSSDHVASYSTRGQWISVCAPGSNILSTTPTYPVTLNSPAEDNLTQNYGKLSGTSMATPLVAGIAALMKSAHPDWDPSQVKQALEASATPIDEGFNPRSGHGRVDAARAVGG